DPDNGNGSASVINLDNVQKVLNTNADIALAAYEDSVDTAKTLQTAIATFAGEPTQANLDAAKSAWLAAREPYGQTEVYRFRLSPIDSTDYTNEDGPEGDINAWPLGEALIDYVVEGNDFGDDQVAVTEHATGVNYPAMNIINSDVEITKELISNTATAEDEKDVIAGYHAIEFMLWGQDLNLDGSADTLEARDSSGGQRPLTDFTSDQYAARRLQFMAVVAEKLIEDLESVRDGWAEGAAYRAAFTSAPDEATAKQKLAEILTGMGTLSEGELAGERMQIAFSANSQEDEHSCFSDNTHRDIWLNAEGVANSYYGVYAGYDSDDDGTDDMTARAVDGYGIDDYLTDAGLDAVKAEMEAALAETETQYMAIDQSARAGTPVDNLIQTAVRNADNPMYKGILALNAQSTVIANIATALTIDGDVVDPDASVCDTTDPATECEE
ncbi:MAG TPA: peptidase, imelysin family protein, partial [Gammaproteobacteria bacterium]|nr:peptidase, imelysin family protein [Gammaproteobacteria bacterium]